MVEDNGELVQLYGAPGQARFDFMWPMISENAIGAVILADNRLFGRKMGEFMDGRPEVLRLREGASPADERKRDFAEVEAALTEAARIDPKFWNARFW